ncbi:hypothetical protein PAPHI01_1202 [Pancytospora philotis]|nr:hypothetical protein PAPHI01_1202 [Pancytospora philotis]
MAFSTSTVESAVAHMCAAQKLAAGRDVQQLLSAGIEEFLLDILAQAEQAAAQSKHKLITADDIVKVSRAHGLPFAPLIDKK